ncbi:1-(5-phosphoribosyl)-5-[(5-phosphoribosylamino)methylideneamino] imidazole-4-carboxamide isomerase [Acidaminococcus sp. CAG:917]|nr:1-(5-phosphoribosyl)-5-[(5-phosphoribosylamino)methylideneamino] imidazole-4-carboxamide isomerase [Acidaminococcus sp. CAG:917]
MKIFPAIDLIDKKVVRLSQGDYSKKTMYSDNPLSVAKSFLKDGATHLHVVDLDGAKKGSPVNFEVIKQLKQLDMFVEVGGGIRDMQKIEAYQKIGVDRVILGTVAIKNFDFVVEAVKEFKDMIAVGVDAKDEKVATHGWQEVTGVNSFEFCKKLYDAGVKSVIYTDIATDGMLKGTNLPAFKRLSKIKGLKVTASGGISSVEEIKKLKEMGVWGAILGKALYENKLSLADAVREEE